MGKQKTKDGGQVTCDELRRRSGRPCACERAEKHTNTQTGPCSDVEAERLERRKRGRDG
jgi:hypothetical protein